MSLQNWLPRWKWRNSRYGLTAFYGATLIIGWLLLRLVLFFSFKSGTVSFLEGLKVFGAGAQRDIFAGLVETLPLLVWWLVLSQPRYAGKFHRTIFWPVLFVVWMVQVFLLFTEFFFFEEFKSRFNTVAVDYLLYPKEVFINIWESYHVGWVLVGCAAASLCLVLVARRLFGGMWAEVVPLRQRLGVLLGTATLAALLALTFHFRGVQVSRNRAVNEIANNGAISFVAAAWTRHLDYSAFYQTLPRAEAFARARNLLRQDGSTFAPEADSLRRTIGGDPNRPKLNLVIILEESLGSEFWGCLGRTNTLTPEMDKLAAEEGMLFTNLYASGNRTVRGMEGVLSSFPPLPGDSIVKRDRSDNVESLARVFKRDGYSTFFVYGGRGLFDGMRSYAVRNGYDRFIEQKHFKNPTFTTIWGVCDEDLFDRSIEECRSMAEKGQPFFATLLTVSNHKPYTYPAGRIPEDPKRQKRNHAVKYSDYALGRFFRMARKEPFWTNTVFAVVADHGARVYGKQSIPIKSYEIPMLVAGPAVVNGPSRVGQLGGSLDVGPTLLGMIGRPYESLFFGRDLLKPLPDSGRALLNHNRDIGMLADDRLIVLGLMQTVEYYEGNPKRVEMTPLDSPGDADKELEKDTTALFQVADELYVNRRYRLDP